MADLQHEDWEDILYEDEEIEDLIKTLKQLNNEKIINSGKIKLLNKLFKY